MLRDYAAGVPVRDIVAKHGTTLRKLSSLDVADLAAGLEHNDKGAGNRAFIAVIHDPGMDQNV